MCKELDRRWITWGYIVTGAVREVPVSRINGEQEAKGGSLSIGQVWRYPPEDPAIMDDPRGAFPSFNPVDGYIRLRNHGNILMVPAAEVREF